MGDFNSILDAAQQLNAGERMRLIDALWETVPDDADLPLHPDWESELGRRVAAINDGAALLVPWQTIRDEALGRIGHGTTR